MCYMAEEEKKLTHKQERFCEEFIIDLNATQAAIRAGYSVDTARSIGCENLTKPDVIDRIAELKGSLRDKNADLAQRVVDELQKVGFSNIADFLEGGNSIKDLSTVDRDLTAAVSSVKKSVTTFGDGEGNEGEKTTVEFKLWDKPAALEKLGKHLGIFEADNKQKKAIITVTVQDGDDD